MNAGTERGWKHRLQHASVITIGLYLATFPATFPATSGAQSRTESIEEFFTPKIYLVRNLSDPLADADNHPPFLEESFKACFKTGWKG